MPVLVLSPGTVMTRLVDAVFVRKILQDEVTLCEAEVVGWVSMQDFFDSLEDSFRHDNQAIIAQLEERISLLRQRQEQLLNLIGQLEESNVSGMV